MCHQIKIQQRNFKFPLFFILYLDSQKSTVILNEVKNPSYPHKDSSPTAQNDATAHSGSLKATRIVLKRLPHSLRSFAMVAFFF